MAMRVSGVATTLFGAAILSNDRTSLGRYYTASPSDENEGCSKTSPSFTCVFPRRTTTLRREEASEGK
jgi:hypothetical protein